MARCRAKSCLARRMGAGMARLADPVSGCVGAPGPGTLRGGTRMVSFEFDEKGLEKHFRQELKKVEAEANRAAARESTPAAKARAFARVLRKHGVKNVSEAELRHRFSG